MIKRATNISRGAVTDRERESLEERDAKKKERLGAW